MTNLSAKQLAPRLGLLVALTPFAVDTYLPAIPEMATALSSTVNHVSLTVPLFLIGFALGQLIGGPLSDRYGRKRIALIGLLIFFVSSLLIMFATQIDQLYMMRIFQALGGGFATVVSAAIVRDLYTGKESARVFSMIALVMLVAPLVAPGVGAMIVNVSGWHEVFAFLAFYSVLLSLLVKKGLPETVTFERRQKMKSQPWYQFALNYRQVITHWRGLGFLVAQGFASSVLFVYITESPFIYMEKFEIDSASFPFYFGIVVLGVMFFNRMNLGLLKRFEPRQIVFYALLAQVALSFSLWVYIVLATESVYVVLIFQFFILGLLGAITPNVQSCYMDYFPDFSGTANALMGTSIFAFGGMMGLLMGGLHNGSLERVVEFISLLSLLSWLMLVQLAKVRFSDVRSSGL